MFIMKTKKTLLSDLIIYSIILSFCFVLVGCSPKSDKDEIARQAALIESLQKDIEMLRANIKGLKQSPAETPAEIKQQADIKLHSKEKQPGDPNELLKEILSGIIAKKEKQSVSELYNKKIQRLQKENNELRKLLSEAIAKAKGNGLAALSVSDRKEFNKQAKERAKAVIAEFDSEISRRGKIELIDSLSELAQAQALPVIDVVRKALADPDPKVGRAALKLIKNYETPEIIPIISQAIKSRDEQTRIDALAPLANIDNPQVVDLLVEALDDTSEEVRSVALEAAQEQGDDIQLNVLEKGIVSSHKDVKSEALSLLEDRSDHASIEIIVTGLLDEDLKFREEVNSVLDFMIDQEFENYETAIDWWDENKHKYDEDLFEIDEDDES
jgi:outer membrane murein-binding lipoprotein Lpp